MVSEAFAGITAFKALFDLAKAMLEASDAAARGIAYFNIVEKLLATQASYQLISQEKDALSAKLKEFETWSAEKIRYELKNVGTGTVAYMLKPDERGSAPPHYVCPACYSNSKISIFQSVRNKGYGAWGCHGCKSLITPGTIAAEWID